MIADVAEPVGNVCVLLALFMFIYAILGVQLFGLEDAHVEWGDEDTRYNFHSFTWGLNSVFVMLTGKGYERTIMCPIPAAIDTISKMSIPFHPLLARYST